MDMLAAFCPVSPGHDALHLAQNRLREKTLAARLCIHTPSFWAVRSADDLASALSDLKGKGVLKTTEQGYDGKGQIRVATGDDAACVPVNRWRPFAYLLMANWLNDLYRDTPFVLESLQE